MKELPGVLLIHSTPWSIILIHSTSWCITHSFNSMVYYSFIQLRDNVGVLFRCVYSGVSSQGCYSFNHPTPCQGWPLLSLFIVSGLLCVCLSGRLTFVCLTPWCAIHSFKSRWCGIHSFNTLVYFLFIRPTRNDWCIIQVCCSFTQLSGILFHAFHSLLCCSCIQLNCLVYYSFMELPRVVYIRPTPWE
jgi:hypothetical protein